VIEERQEDDDAFGDRRPQPRIELAPPVSVPAFDRLELVEAVPPAGALRLLNAIGHPA
jgi:hypothetical protein